MRDEVCRVRLGDRPTDASLDRPTPPLPPRSLRQGAGGCETPPVNTPSPEDRGRGFIKGGGGLTPRSGRGVRQRGCSRDEPRGGGGVPKKGAISQEARRGGGGGFA